MTCPEHQLVLHLLLVVELLLQLEQARVFKALLHLNLAFEDGGSFDTMPRRATNLSSPDQTRAAADGHVVAPLQAAAVAAAVVAEGCGFLAAGWWGPLTPGRPALCPH